MINEIESYKVAIFGDQYTIRTDEQSDKVMQSAALVDSIMKEIARASHLDTKSIAVLAALRIAHQLFDARFTNGCHQTLIDLIDKEMARIDIKL